MRALVLDGTLSLAEVPTPDPPPGEARIRVTMAGVCNTDLELCKGYMGFRGIPGHEFVGVIEACEDPTRVGRRVVGEINCGCGACGWCARGDARHCPGRTTLGIDRRDGAFAEFLTLPVRNLLEVPAGLPDRVAVFTEPVAAAYEILEQLHLAPGERVTVLGDGKLGLLVSQVLARSGCDLLAVGRHPEKLEVLSDLGIRTLLARDWNPAGDQDVAVEVTGTAEGILRAMEAVRPRGRVVLKTTVEASTTLHLAPLVIRELTLVGSRCGPMAPALRALAAGALRVEPLIEAEFPLSRGLEAFARAGRRGARKVLVHPG